MLSPAAPPAPMRPNTHPLPRPTHRPQQQNGPPMRRTQRDASQALAVPPPVSATRRRRTSQAHVPERIFVTEAARSLVPPRRPRRSETTARHHPHPPTHGVGARMRSPTSPQSPSSPAWETPQRARHAGASTSEDSAKGGHQDSMAQACRGCLHRRAPTIHLAPERPPHHRDREAKGASVWPTPEATLPRPPAHQTGAERP